VETQVWFVFVVLRTARPYRRRARVAVDARVDAFSVGPADARGGTDAADGVTVNVDMTQITLPVVEEWLDAHPDHCQDYFLRKVELDLINKWLVSHGFLNVNDYVSSATSTSSSGNVSPANGPAAPNAALPSILVNGNNSLSVSPAVYRSNSKRCRRHDFARAKARSVLRTQEIGKDAPICSSRRSSLKDMRK